MIDKALCNIILLALAFFAQYAAYISICNAQKYILEALKKEDPNYKGLAYASLCIMFAVSAVFYWCTPLVINLLKLRLTFIIGSIFNILYIAQFLYPMTWMLYFSSVVSGIFLSLIWAAQGTFLTLNSTNKTISRNSGILWAIIQAGYVLGNLYVYCILKESTITKSDRNLLFGTMTFMCFLSFFIFLFLKKPQCGEEIKVDTIKLIKDTLKLFIKRDMLILSVTFLYSGLLLSFYAGIYSTAMGFTKRFESEETKMVTMSGVLIGLGEVVSGTIIGVLGHIKKDMKRSPILILGGILSVITFTIILINVPNCAVNKSTYDAALVMCNKYIGLLCSFLLGFADSCFITQIYGLLGSVFQKESSSAFSIFKFLQSLSCAISFFYTSPGKIGLYVILSILYVFAIGGTICFCIVEYKPTYVQPIDTTEENSKIGATPNPNTDI